MKYIVSFTTSPKRIVKCETMINSILNQTLKPDLIILNIPKIFSRTGKKYIIPEFIKKNVLINVIEQDLGPITKIIPTIKFLNERNFDKKNTRIIYIDDDIKYMNGMIECFHEASIQNNKIIVTGSGFNFFNHFTICVPKNGSNCSIVEGFGGVCVSLSIFENDILNYVNKYLNFIDCKFSDDVILSNYYHKKNCIMKIVNEKNKFSTFEMRAKGDILDYGLEEDALHNGAYNTIKKNLKRYKSVVQILFDYNDMHFKYIINDHDLNDLQYKFEEDYTLFKQGN